jgi:hypothetical protein
LNGASFQRLDTKIASFGALGGITGIASTEQATANGDALAPVAKTQPGETIDALFATLVETADHQKRKLTAEEIAQFVKASAYLQSAEPVAPLDGGTAPTLVADVRARIGVTGSYGIGDTLKKAAAGLADAARNQVSNGLVWLGRDRLNPRVAQFLGDIFLYLKDGGIRDAVRARVSDALHAAHDAAKGSGRPLVVIGHSLGGVILVDLLSNADAAGLNPDLKVDVLITVGSQPGFFEELGLIERPTPAVAGAAKAPAPSAVDHWLNVLDPIDLFGFRAQPIFDKVEDLEFDSNTGLLSSHTTYFTRPLFHARLRERLIKLGLIG